MLSDSVFTQQKNRGDKRKGKKIQPNNAMEHKGKGLRKKKIQIANAGEHRTMRTLCECLVFFCKYRDLGSASFKYSLTK